MRHTDNGKCHVLLWTVALLCERRCIYLVMLLHHLCLVLDSFHHHLHTGKGDLAPADQFMVYWLA